MANFGKARVSALAACRRRLPSLRRQRLEGCSLDFHETPAEQPLRLKCREHGCKFFRVWRVEEMIAGLGKRKQGGASTEVAALGAMMTTPCPVCKKAGWVAEVLWVDTATMGWKVKGERSFGRHSFPFRGGNEVFKVLAFLTKKDGLSTDDFIDYYENHHVPLILNLATPPLLYKRRYRGEALTRADRAADFDVVTELGFADRAGYLAWMAQLADSGGRVAADEARFLDRSRTRAYVVEERPTAE